MHQEHVSKMISLDKMGLEIDCQKQTHAERTVNDGLQMLLDRWRVQEEKLQVLEESLKNMDMFSLPLEEEVKENKCIYDTTKVQGVSLCEQIGHPISLSLKNDLGHDIKEVEVENRFNMSSILENIQGHGLDKDCCVVPQKLKSFENLNSINTLSKSSHLQLGDSMAPKNIRQKHDQVNTPNYTIVNEGDALKDIMNDEDYSQELVDDDGCIQIRGDFSTNGDNGLIDSTQATKDNVYQGSKRVFGNKICEEGGCASSIPCVNSFDSLGFMSMGFPKSDTNVNDTTCYPQFHDDEQIDGLNVLSMQRTNLYQSFVIAENRRDSVRRKEQLFDNTNASRQHKHNSNLDYCVEVSSQIKLHAWKIMN